jgi:molybdopterin-binding protein
MAEKMAAAGLNLEAGGEVLAQIKSVKSEE